MKLPKKLDKYLKLFKKRSQIEQSTDQYSDYEMVWYLLKKFEETKEMKYIDDAKMILSKYVKQVH